MDQCAEYVRIIFFFFKQKTAYELRISDWSSDVCSSDLGIGGRVELGQRQVHRLPSGQQVADSRAAGAGHGKQDVAHLPAVQIVRNAQPGALAVGQGAAEEALWAPVVEEPQQARVVAGPRLERSQ